MEPSTSTWPSASLDMEPPGFTPPRGRSKTPEVVLLGVPAGGRASEMGDEQWTGGFVSGSGLSSGGSVAQVPGLDPGGDSSDAAP